MQDQSAVHFSGLYRATLDNEASFEVPEEWLPEHDELSAVIYPAGDGFVVRQEVVLPNVPMVNLAWQSRNQAIITDTLWSELVDALRGRAIVLVGRGDHFVIVQDGDGWEERVARVGTADPVQ